MIYVCSDLHGNLQSFKKLLKKINMQKEKGDRLIILGDVIDRGQHSIELLQYIMDNKNIELILGNHEILMYESINLLNKPIENSSISKLNDNIDIVETWLLNGGSSTLDSFIKLNTNKRADIMEYLDNSKVYDTLEVNEKQYLLVHAGLGLNEFDPNKELYKYSIDELVWGKTDYSHQYFKDKILVTGHTPTFLIDQSYKGKIYRKNGHIALDTGGFVTGRYSAICLDTSEEFYVEDENIKNMCIRKYQVNQNVTFKHFEKEFSGVIKGVDRFDNKYFYNIEIDENGEKVLCKGFPEENIFPIKGSNNHE